MKYNLKGGSTRAASAEDLEEGSAVLTILVMKLMSMLKINDITVTEEEYNKEMVNKGLNFNSKNGLIKAKVVTVFTDQMN